LPRLPLSPRLRAPASRNWALDRVSGQEREQAPVLVPVPVQELAWEQVLAQALALAMAIAPARRQGSALQPHFRRRPHLRSSGVKRPKCLCLQTAGFCEWSWRFLECHE